jgi:hypothetical protein
VSRFHKRQVVYMAGTTRFEGAERPIVFPVLIQAVAPQRDGSFRYHVRNWEGLPRPMQWESFNVAEDVLHEDPLAAMQAAIAEQAGLLAWTGEAADG